MRHQGHGHRDPPQLPDRGQPERAHRGAPHRHHPPAAHPAVPGGSCQRCAAWTCSLPARATDQGSVFEACCKHGRLSYAMHCWVLHFPLLAQSLQLAQGASAKDWLLLHWWVLRLICLCSTARWTPSASRRARSCAIMGTSRASQVHLRQPLYSNGNMQIRTWRTVQHWLGLSSGLWRCPASVQPSEADAVPDAAVPGGAVQLQQQAQRVCWLQGCPSGHGGVQRQVSSYWSLFAHP